MLNAASPRLSIVIPSQQRIDLLRPCLESVWRHAPPSTEMIVVDDGSAAATVSLTALDFPGTRVLRLPRSHGFCFAANRGIEAARGEFIQLLNDDTQVEPGWADAALTCFVEPQVGAVTPLVLRGTPGDPDPLIDSAGDGYDPGGFAWKIGRGQRLRGDYLGPATVRAASGSSVLLRRSALERTGLFPEHFGAYFEDVDLSLRLAAAGFTIRYEPTSRVWHRVGSSYGQPRRRLVERQSCNEEWLFWRNLDRRRPWPALLRHLAVLGGKAVRRAREGTFLPFLFGRLRAFARVWRLTLKKDERSCPKHQLLGPC
jgi:GT2 family glycosyltransferase